MAKRVKAIDFELDELFQLQEEILANIPRFGGENKTSTRVSRMVRNKLEACRSYVRAQSYLERNGHIVLDKG